MSEATRARGDQTAKTADEADAQRARLVEQIRLYTEKERPAYKALGQLVEAVLGRAVKHWDPLAHVIHRAKDPASFAEKAIRKKLVDPIQQMNDLCGARVVVRSDAVVEQVCRFIEAHFEVDERSDWLEGMDPDQFGYRSIHYIVRLPAAFGSPDRDPKLAPEDAGHLAKARAGDRVRRAEIQVRTHLQNVWADVAHDRLYKTHFRVPKAQQREGYRLAAILEAADRQFGTLMENVDAYETDLGAHLRPEERARERDTLRLLLAIDDKDVARQHPSYALKLAKLYRVDAQWDDVIAAVERFVAVDGPEKSELRLLYAQALYRRSRNAGDPEFDKGFAILREVVDRATPEEADLATRALLLLERAARLRNTARSAQESLELCRAAFERDPASPYSLAAFLEAEVRFRRSGDVLGLLRPQIERAIDAAAAHVTARAELPRSAFTFARLNLFIGRQQPALLGLCRAICAATRAQILDEIETLAEMHSLLPREQAAVFAAASLLLTLGAGGAGEERADALRPALESVAELDRSGRGRGEPVLGEDRKPRPIGPPVVIVAGGASPDLEPWLSRYEPLLSAALDGLGGTVFGGGSRTGIPGQLGQVADALRKLGRKSFELAAYLPEYRPENGREDERYNRLFVIKGQQGFSAAEPLRAWAHILASGVDPADVRVLAINGGDVTELEMYVGLALGARVGIVRQSGRRADAVAAIPDDEVWWTSGQRLVLPDDAMTIRAFLQAEDPDAAQPGLEAGARYVHEVYRQATIKNLLPWDSLSDEFKRSSRRQAAYAERMVAAAGFAVRETERPDVVTLDARAIESLAEMEHGRFVVERLLDGWTAGPKRDDERRDPRSPRSVGGAAGE